MPDPSPYIGEPYEPYGLWEGPGLGWTRQDRQFHVEGMMRMYPHGAAMGFGASPICLFHGEEYAAAMGGTILTPTGGMRLGYGYGCDVAFGWDLFKSVGHFVSNAVKAAGREIGHAMHSIQDVAGKISKEIAKIPIVGGALHVIFDAVYHASVGLLHMTVSIVIEGKRIDKVVMDHLTETLHDFKQVAPYAQMVISLVPGIGPGVSAALSAGLALAEGQPIAEVLKAGLIGAIPGGPLVKAAVTMGVETIQHVASGQKLDFATLANTAGGIAASALGIPIAAKNALMAGISTIGAIAKGNPLDKAITDGVIAALPIDNTIKQALTQASTVTLDLAHGKRVDKVLLSQLDNVAAMLPVDNALKDTLKTGVGSIKNLAAGKKPEDVLFGALQSGLGDTLVSMGAAHLPSDVQKAIKSGVAMGSGVVEQANRALQLVQKVPGKLVESGVQLAKSAPLFAEARKLVPTGGSYGFDIGAGLMQQQAKLFDIATMRNTLKPPDKIGFDLALSTRIGAVANPKPATLSPAAHAGHAITMGMQSYAPAQKVVMMKAVQTNPSAAVGATEAVKAIAVVRDNWLVKLLRALGLHK
jgi:hypothetical protein